MQSDFDAWLAEGIQKNYCSKMYCETHNPHPTDCKEEIQQKLDQYKQEWDFCWLVVHIKDIDD
tara:strand:- start:242 stop:430 length:189 start_codon:yes stop_codon:yes gene_type:complete